MDNHIINNYFCPVKYEGNSVIATNFFTGIKRLI